MKLWHVTSLMTVGASLSVFQPTSAAVVALYDFQGGGSGDTFAGQAGLNSVDAETNSTATGLVSTGLDGGGATNIFSTAQPGSASGTPHSNWGNGGLAEGSANFASFTTSPTAGFQITYESLSLYHGAFNNTPKFKITYAIGAGPDTVALATTSHTTGVGNGATLEFKTSDFADFTTDQTVTWKIFIFDANDNNTGTRFDDITINGSVTLIPEPGTLALLGLGGLFVAQRRRR